MASTKDILSAQRFNRARLMTAFQSGMPGGRELTPTRPWGGLIGGIVLTILLFGVSWVSTLFAPSLPSGWDHGSLLTDENTGARYVSIEGTLHPVRNASSAHLLFPDNLTIVSAGSEALSEADIGPEVGITGAPDQVPTPESVADPTLLTCSAGAAPWTGVNTGEWTSADDRGVHVTVGTDSYLVAGGYRYSLGDENHSPEAVLTAVGLSADVPRQVSATWINVFPEGEPLVSLTVPGLGGEAGSIEGVADDVAVGTILEVSDTANAGTLYLVHEDARIERLTPVMYQLYAIGDGGIYSSPVPISSRDLARLQLVDSPTRPTWPEEITGTFEDEEVPCGYLSADSRGSVQLVLGRDIPSVASRTVTVAPQSGAIIRTRTDANLGFTHLIDESGTVFTLAPAADTLSALGLEEADDLIVETQWRDLFDAGPILSTNEVWQTVPAGSQ